MTDLTLPHNYTPRPYQLPFLRAFDNSIINGVGKVRKFVLVWHRRSGKEKTIFNVVIKEAQRVRGIYYYLFPTYSQGKKILWEGMDKEGYRFLEHIPSELIEGKPNDSEMKIKFKNGSIIQVIGTDNYNSIVGTNPRGMVFSEYALQDPNAWAFMRPIMAENNGWVIFDYTPRGENHGKDMYDMAISDNENYYCQLLTVDDTKAIPVEVLENERKEITKFQGNDALYQQEYMCSFTAPVLGAYYGTQMMTAEAEHRITTVPHEKGIPVDTYWDLGMDDAMSIGFCQVVGKEIRWIDYFEGQGEGLPYYAKVLQDKPYIYGEHYAPFDIEVRELGSGLSRKDTARTLGITFRVAPKLEVIDGIHAVRMLFDFMWFDRVKCQRLITALKSYHKEYDEVMKIYRNHAEHDWSSHASDMLRVFAVSFNKNKMQNVRRVSPFAANIPKPDRGTIGWETAYGKQKVSVS